MPGALLLLISRETGGMKPLMFVGDIAFLLSSLVGLDADDSALSAG